MSTSTVVRVAPVTEPVTLTEAKRQCRIEASYTNDDDLLNFYISAARDRAEKYCNRFFTAQEITILFDGRLPSTLIELPYPDLTSVDAVKYTDPDGAIQTVAPADYIVDLERRTIFAPSGFTGDSINYRVEATTGAPVELEGAKVAMLMMVTDFYELRTENVIAASVTENPAMLSALYPYRFGMGV